MLVNHVALLFIFAAILIAIKIYKDRKSLPIHKERETEHYLVNILLFPSFKNAGLIIYGFILVLFLFSPDELFLLFATNINELTIYLAILAIYMILKGIFEIGKMFTKEK